ncbi:MAG: hypothetical protein Q9175_003717 [Cornicularia normoerica]
MSNQDPNRPSSPPRSRPSFPPQPYQVLEAVGGFTPFYVSDEEAKRFPGHITPHLSNNLKHPPENYPVPRNLFPGTDPIMDARKEDGGRPGELSHKQVAALKDVKDMTIDERHARDVCGTAKEFSPSPPDALPHAQRQRWAVLFAELFGKEKPEEEVMQKGKAEDEELDPYKIRPRGELRKLKRLADLAGGKKE